VCLSPHTRSHDAPSGYTLDLCGALDSASARRCAGTSMTEESNTDYWKMHLMLKPKVVDEETLSTPNIPRDRNKHKCEKYAKQGPTPDSSEAVQILHPSNQHRLRRTRRGSPARPRTRTSQHRTAMKQGGQLAAGTCSNAPPLFQPSSHFQR